MSWTHDDDQLIIEQYERTIAQLKEEARAWQARYDELLRIYNERPEVQEAQKLQATLDILLAMQQVDEQQLAEARTLLEQVESLIVSDNGDFSGWLNAYAAFAEKDPKEASE